MSKLYCVFHLLWHVNLYLFYFYRFLNCSQKWMDHLKHQINELITNYVKQPSWIEETDSIITHITRMQCMSKKQMLNIFNSISNYHWIDYPRFKKGKGLKDNSTRYSSHLLWFPDDQDKRNHLPTSPGCAFSSFIYLKKNTRMQLVPLLPNLWRKIKDNEQKILDCLSKEEKRWNTLLHT